METLLPSEIARLVLGYLEETQCSKVAKMFLDTSSLLEECRYVALKGKKFSTKVHGFTLIDILEKFWAINAAIQDRCSKLQEYEQLQHKDLSEQLELLIDSSHGQRFSVSINVPSQTSKSMNTSPVIASNTKKRRRSESHDRNKCKRALKSNSLYSDKSFQTDATELDDATQQPVSPMKDHRNASSSKTNLEELNASFRDDSPIHQSSVVETGTAIVSNNQHGIDNNPHNKDDNLHNKDKNLQKNNNNHQNNDNSSLIAITTLPKTSTATDTLELMQYVTTEVQTVLEDVESESDSTDMPVENLSLLTKELLNRTELQERIAENINEVLSSDSLVKNSSIIEICPGELNTSIMSELNNAIKSIVTATETDPVFENFLHEIIGTNIDCQNAIEDDDRPKAIEYNGVPDTLPQIIKTFPLIEQHLPEKVPDVSVNNELPHFGTSTTTTNTQNSTENKIQEKPLDDYNTAAIQSIIDVNNLLLEEKHRSNQNVETTENLPPKELTSSASESVNQAITDVRSEKTLRKPNKRTMRQKSIMNVVNTVNTINTVNNDTANAVTNDAETVPTLIFCSKEEVSKYVEPVPTFHNTSKSRFVPIAPKTVQLAPETIYLRAVNVSQKKSCDKTKVIQSTVKKQCVKETTPLVTQSSEYPAVISNLDVCHPESITLYGSENNASSVLKSVEELNINMQDSVSISGTGLSPYLKLNNHPKESKTNTVSESYNNDVNTTESSTKNKTYEIVVNTPKSLLKSRSKNRLSLSTPRRRSSHVRALDFNTPPENFKKNNSLFKSSPFQNFEKSLKLLKHKTPDKIKRSLLAPIATRSPIPVLKGGWNEVSGIGSIIRTQSDSSPPQKRLAFEGDIEKPTAKKAWDADLRKSLDLIEDLTVNKAGPGPDKTKNKSKEDIKNDSLASAEQRDTNYLELTEKTNNKSSSKQTKSSKQNKQNDGKLRQSQKSELDTLTPETLAAKGIVKKYAKLKTITTKISTEKENFSNFFNADIETTTKSSNTMIDLETPRKAIFGIPPTPRVLSPNNNSFMLATNEESLKVQCFVPTPEFPPTPNINLTPQEKSINTTDATKKGFTAPYYQPSFELETDEVKNKLETNSSKGNESNEPLSNKLEITQFEVIKENLPKLNDSKEYEVSTFKEAESLKWNEASTKDDSNKINDSEMDSSSSSSCSSCSSSSASSCSRSMSVSLSRASLHEEKLNSPPKTFPIKKLDDALTSMNTETPQKDETLLIEANISETPSGSKSGMDTVTNLTSKISEMIAVKPLNRGNNNPCENFDLLSKSNINNTDKKLDEELLNAKTMDQMRSELNEKRLRIMEKLNPKNVAASKKAALKPKREVKKNVKSRSIKENEEHEKSVKKADKSKERSNSKCDSKNSKDTIISANDKDNNIIENSDNKKPENQKKEEEEKGKKIKNCIKSKVDMVKRDLFSDEENNDCGNSKLEKPKSQENVESALQTNATDVQNLIEILESSKEKLVVLESLELVPSSKCNPIPEMEVTIEGCSRNHLEISIVHDEKLTKRRKRKLNPENLSFKIQTDDDSWVKITTSPFEEIFNIIPCRLKPRKVKLTTIKSILTPEKSCPLATSSPISPIKTSKMTKKEESTSTQDKTANGEKQDVKENKVNPDHKTNDSESKDKEVNKDGIGTSDPKILLGQVDINKFLTKIHGPES